MYIVTWAGLNALHKDVPRLNDLLTWKKRKMKGTMREFDIPRP
jgi:hypothetical protein